MSPSLKQIRVAVIIANCLIVGVREFREPLRVLATSTIAKPVAAETEQRKNAIAEFVAPSLSKTPVVGDRIAGYTVSSPFGMRTHPVTGEQKHHSGVDLATPEGTPLYAAIEAGQTVDLICGNEPDGYGLWGSYRLPDGSEIRLAHLKRCIPRTYRAGEAIANTGNTGMSTGAHLHLELLQDGKKVAPPADLVWQTMTGRKPSPVLKR